MLHVRGNVLPRRMRRTEVHRSELNLLMDINRDLVARLQENTRLNVVVAGICRGAMVSWSLFDLILIS